MLRAVVALVLGPQALLIELDQQATREGYTLLPQLVHVPHPRHDDFLDDPTHVRAITPKLLKLFDRRINDTVNAQEGANMELVVDTTRLHFFDPESSEAIY